MIETVGDILQWAGLVALPFAFIPLIALLLIQTPAIGPLATAMYPAIRIIDGASYRIGEIVKWGLLLMVIGVTATVVLAFFGLSITKLDEGNVYIHAAVIMLGAAATALAGGHVSVDVIFTHLSDGKKNLITVLGYYLLLLPVAVAVVYYSQKYVGRSWSILQGSTEQTGLPFRYLFNSLIPAFGVMMAVQGASLAARAVLEIAGRTPPPAPSHTTQPDAEAGV